MPYRSLANAGMLARGKFDDRDSRSAGTPFGCVATSAACLISLSYLPGRNVGPFLLEPGKSIVGFIGPKKQ